VPLGNLLYLQGVRYLCAEEEGIIFRFKPSLLSGRPGKNGPGFDQGGGEQNQRQAEHHEQPAHVLG